MVFLGEWYHFQKCHRIQNAILMHKLKRSQSAIIIGVGVGLGLMVSYWFFAVENNLHDLNGIWTSSALHPSFVWLTNWCASITDQHLRFRCLQAYRRSAHDVSLHLTFFAVVSHFEEEEEEEENKTKQRDVNFMLTSLTKKQHTVDVCGAASRSTFSIYVWRWEYISFAKLELYFGFRRCCCCSYKGSHATQLGSTYRTDDKNTHGRSTVRATKCTKLLVVRKCGQFIKFRWIFMFYLTVEWHNNSNESMRIRCRLSEWRVWR